MTIDAARAEIQRREEKYEAERQRFLDDLPEDVRREIEPVRKVGALTRFTANGNAYVVREDLTLTRYEEFERLQIHVGYGVAYDNLFANLRKAYDYLNEGRSADAAVVVYNVLNGAAKNYDRRESPVLMLCTLFISREGEDLTAWDAALARDKIEDWKVEGISMDDFFALAFASVRGLVPNFGDDLAAISENRMTGANGEKTKNPTTAKA